jgi:hypothetical protein
MRFAITGISRRGGRSKASDVCAFVRRCKAGKPYSHHTVTISHVYSCRFGTTDTVREGAFQETVCHCSISRENRRR